MASLHLLVPAVLVCVGQSTACVEWMIANPPIIFGKTARLVCAPVTPNISSNIHNVTSWLGGKDYSILTYNGGTADPRKYAEIQRWHRGKFESILQIYRFDEMDVNVNYSCSIGGCVNIKRLSLTPDKFEYHPDKDTTRVVASFRNGYLDVIVKIMKVYPNPNCTIMFNENIISRGLTTKTSVNGTFYMVAEDVDQHYFNVCSSQLIVTCLVGKTEIPIYQQAFNKCTKTKEESPVYIINLWISTIVGVLLLLILVIGMGCLARYGKLKNVLCCKRMWGGEERTLARHIVQIVSKFIIQRTRCSTYDARKGENHEMMPPFHRNSGNDILINYDRHMK